MPWHDKKNQNSENRSDASPAVNPNSTMPVVKPLANVPSYGYLTTQKERPLREYVAIAIHYRYLIIFLTILGAFVGYLQNKKITTMYTSEALVNIGTYVAPTDGPVGVALQNESISGDYINNLLHVVMSYRIAQYIYLNDEKIWNHFNPGIPHIKKSEVTEEASADITGMSTPQLVDEKLASQIPVPALDAYLARISYIQVNGTSMIRIYAKARNPELAAYFANTHSKAFIEFVREKRLQSALINVNYMKKRIQELTQKSDEIKEKMIKYAKDNNLSFGNTNSTSDGNLLSVVNSLSQSTTERTILDEEVRELRPGQTIDSMKLAGGDAVALVSKITDLESRYNQIYEVSRNHPELKFIKIQIENIKKTLKFSADQTRKQSELRRKAAQAKENLLRNEYERLKKNESSQAQHIFQYNLLESEYKAVNDTLAQVRKRLEDATVQAESDQQTAHVIDSALPPMIPSLAPRPSNVVTTALIGLFVGIGLAFLLDSQDGSIRTITDVKQTLELPILGVIPAFSKKIMGYRADADRNANTEIIEEFEIEEIANYDMTQPFADAINALYQSSSDSLGEISSQVNKDNHPVVIISSPFSREAEAFRNLRTTIMFSRSEVQPRKILFTSAEKGVGKTTVAVNVAASLAQIGAKVVLVDTDLRMPTTHEHFGISRHSTGLTEYLEGRATLNNVITDSKISNLSLILAGAVCANPSELLSSHSMLSMLDQLTEQFDFVILDTPPVGEIADALLLSNSADGVIMVVRSGFTLKNSAKMAYTRLTQVKAHMLGVAFNCVRSLDTYREGYHYYSQYSGYGYNNYYNAPPKELNMNETKFDNRNELNI